MLELVVPDKQKHKVKLFFSLLSVKFISQIPTVCLLHILVSAYY